MQSFDIVKTSDLPTSFRASSISGMFDLKAENLTERFAGELTLPDTWQIGCIVGNSGTGKTTIAKHLFPDCYIERFEYDTAKPIVDEMPDGVSVQDIAQAFNSVGFSSPPAWLKSYHVLSNGQKMRADLARCILSTQNLFVFDEFTSVVDRTVAQVGSFAIQKAIRKTEKQFIAVTCHFDVIDWLLPDWVFDTNSMTFSVNSKKKDQTLTLKFSRQQISRSGACLLNTII